MGGSYWEPLSDVLPADVLNAMSRATQPGSADRYGETGIHTAVRALIAHTVPRAEHDSRIAELVKQQRSTFEAGQRAAREAYDRAILVSRTDREALDRVRALVDRHQKTLPMADLIAALNSDPPSGGRAADRYGGTAS
jgi:hypothetical protein